jgi:antagonist of KipI
VLLVRTPGLLTTVQGAPRHGRAHLGFPAGGAADAVSLRLGNRLVGNPDDAAALEMTLVGGTFEFADDAAIALTGADLGAALDGAPAPWGRTLLVRAGQMLACAGTRDGARGYLCVRGGILAAPGTPLHRAAAIVVGPLHGAAPPLRIDERIAAELRARTRLRVTAGTQQDWFEDESLRTLGDAEFSVSERSDRRGLRLAGPALTFRESRQLVTEGVTPGALQVTPNGQVILLLVDGPTTGGYPKIAHVAAVDLHRAGQARPRDVLRFEALGVDEALALLCEQERLLAAAVVPA